MAKVMICDRCGELMQKTYYEILISAHDVEISALINAETLSHNLCTAMSMTFNGKKAYCKKCVDEINKVINDKGGASHD